MAINAEQLDLRPGERTALSKVRLDKATQSLLQAILDSIEWPKNKKKVGQTVFDQIGAAMHQISYREGVKDVIEVLSGKDEK